jgi:microsomal prostaglandin-E synthase 2
VSSEPAAKEEQKWRDWVDTTFVKLVTANIYSSWGQSFQTMKYITESGQWGTMERALAYNGGAVLMYAVGSRMPKKYGFEGDLRVLLYKEIDSFVDSCAFRLPPCMSNAHTSRCRPP